MSPLPARANTLHSLLDAYQRFAGTWARPTIGILDWSDVPTMSEFLLFQDYFSSLGYTCIIGDPRHCEYQNGRLYVDGVAIDLIYKRVLISELIERGGLDHPIVRAVRDRAVCMVNPFRCKILHKKASLAVLSDDRNERLFSSVQREAIATHVPWTRVVEERTTSYQGGTVDLIAHIADRKDEFVLKPNDDYGGAGVVLGWEATPDVWQATIRRALDHPYIVQQRIELPYESYPSYADGALVYADRITDTAPYCFDGAVVDGCLSRISSASLVNVTAGGGSTVPTFVVDSRT
ncbi:MAG: ATP-grasp domain-containing protein [Gemmatimonadales bacterium]